MIAWIVRRIVDDGYAKQNRGEFASLARMFAADGVFEFMATRRSAVNAADGRRS